MEGKKIHLNMDVYQAVQRRLAFIFGEFDNIYVSFSGGKDSGLLLNLCLQYMRANGITRKIGVFHQDFEAQYSATTEYVTRTMSDNQDLMSTYWSCLPMTVQLATSMHQTTWCPWDPDLQDIWVRPLPKHPGILTLDNHPLDFYRLRMRQEDLYREFSPWYHHSVGGGIGKTCCLVGIRTAESLNRWRAISQDKGTYRRIPWTTKLDENVYAGYPLYDWSVEDIWTANARFGFDYNRVYDLFHYAGLSLHEMRVASPFGDWANNGSLALYRAIEPNIWARLVGRVDGANFTSIYGATHAAGYKSIKLPKGHTWKSYLDFLLGTLPEETRLNYQENFSTSVNWWLNKGGVLSIETIAELNNLGVKIKLQGKSNYHTDKEKVVFKEYPDDLDVTEFASVPSYKRMCICILKNDHLCKYMGFALTKLETGRRKAALDKYRDI